MTTRNRMTDREEFERELSALLAAEGESARAAADPPPAARVWFRAQTRARREALEAVNRPLTLAHALGIACGGGLLLAAITIVASRLDFTFPAATLAAGLGDRWLTVSLTAMLVSVVVVSIAAYVVFADE